MINRLRVKRIGMVCACLVLAGTIYTLATGCFSPADFMSYHKFLGKVQEKMSGKSKTPYSAEQVRRGISREVWFKSGTHQLKAYLTAQEAEFAYEGVGSDLSIVEELKDVKGWVQNRLYALNGVPMQSVSYFEAENAVYRNAKQEIYSDNVHMALYDKPGHELNGNALQIEDNMISGSAQSLTISIPEKLVVFISPNGKLHDDKESCRFSSGILIWDAIANRGCLADNVKIDLPGRHLALESDELILDTGKNGLEYIYGYGMTTLSSIDPEKDTILQCDGEVKVDCMQQLALMQTSHRGKQLYLKDHNGTIYADKALLKYEKKNNHLQPLNTEFLGNVSVTNRRPPFLRKVLADQVNYSFLTREVDFNSQTNNRVLFYDQANNLKMSAKGLNVYKDIKSNKEAIKGKGDVRLRFDEQEITRLKKRLFDHDG